MAGETRQKKDLASIKTSTSYAKGLGGKRKPEDVPNFAFSSVEKGITGPYNSSIVLGKDRHGSEFQGFSAKGYTQSGMIDLVAGRASGLSITEFTDPETGKKETLYVNPDFQGDAARIYMSQKTDIDSLIGLEPKKANNVIGFVPENKISSFGKSSVFITSDHTRIMGRERIVLSTQFLGFNSLNGPVRTGGIDIIAGNIQDNDQFSVQPMVKGDNLDKCLSDIIEYITNITKYLDKFVNFQLKFNDHIEHHRHTLESLEPPLTNPPLQKNIEDMENEQLNIYNEALNLKQYVAQKIVFLHSEYLTDSGNTYIKSHFNKVN